VAIRIQEFLQDTSCGQVATLFAFAYRSLSSFGRGCRCLSDSNYLFRWHDSLFFFVSEAATTTMKDQANDARYSPTIACRLDDLSAVTNGPTTSEFDPEYTTGYTLHQRSNSLDLTALHSDTATTCTSTTVPVHIGRPQNVNVKSLDGVSQPVRQARYTSPHC